MSTALARTHAFGDISIDLESRGVMRAGKAIRLEPKAAAVLRALIAADPEPVSREQLLDLCWEQGRGSDEALTQAIAQIRRALGEDSGAPRFIATVPKVGYRWLAPDGAPVEEPANQPRSGFRFSPIAALAVIMFLCGMIAVLAFTRVEKKVDVVKVYKGGAQPPR